MMAPIGALLVAAMWMEGFAAQGGCRADADRDTSSACARLSSRSHWLL